MIGIVIVAHGGLAVEYKSALEHVVGIQNDLIAIGIEENHDRKQKTKEICDCVNKVDSGAGVILVTDLFGGTPSNLSLEACSKENRIIVYGANLPMLVKLAKSRNMNVKDAAREALDAGRKYINSHSCQ